MLLLGKLDRGGSFTQETSFKKKLLFSPPLSQSTRGSGRTLGRGAWRAAVERGIGGAKRSENPSRRVQTYILE